MKNVGFLYFGPSSHIYHSLSIAIELAKLGNVAVHVIYSGEINKKIIEENIDTAASRINLTEVYPSYLSRLKDRLKKRMHYRVRTVVSHNIDLLNSMDALVVTDINHVSFNKHIESEIIHCGHGTGDNKYGFSPSLALADLLLVSGERKKTRLSQSLSINPNKVKAVGYPKFDFLENPEHTTKQQLFGNDNLTILYNPHIKDGHSWLKYGVPLLEFFMKHKEFNLICAPHVLLFSKGEYSIDDRYFSAKNIHIDIDSKSQSLIDFTYTKMADIYLGDLSSQVYEFVGIKPRPVVFINTNKVDWQGDDNYTMWNMGAVVNCFDELSAVLKGFRLDAKGVMTNDEVPESCTDFLGVQHTYISDVFSSTQNSGRTAANAIHNYIIGGSAANTEQTTNVGALDDNKLNVAFLYVGPTPHIFHSLTIAKELSQFKNIQVSILVSGDENKRVLANITWISELGFETQEIFPSMKHRFFARFKRRMNYRSKAVINNNQAFIDSFDVTVVTDCKHVTRQPKSRVVYVPHGASDARLLETEQCAIADLVFCPGRKRYNNLLKYQMAKAERLKVIGYPKFDYISPTVKGELFDNDNPIVLYNPHFTKYSSWHDWGVEVLKYFRANKQFNLIFAPHILLFSKMDDKELQAFKECPNIHIDIDVNSVNLIDASYTKLADLYIGDVSSQVNEFVAMKPRPCLFMNPHDLASDNELVSDLWSLGAVVNDIHYFGESLEQSFRSHERFLGTQRQFVEDTFLTVDEDCSASVMAAKAIAELIRSNV